MFALKVCLQLYAKDTSGFPSFDLHTHTRHLSDAAFPSLMVCLLCPGGLGEAVLSAVGAEPGIVVTRLAVSGVPRSGKPQELLDMFGISAKYIANAVRQTFAN